MAVRQKGQPDPPVPFLQGSERCSMFMTEGDVVKLRDNRFDIRDGREERVFRHRRCHRRHRLNRRCPLPPAEEIYP